MDNLDDYVDQFEDFKSLNLNLYLVQEKNLSYSFSAKNNDYYKGFDPKETSQELRAFREFSGVPRSELGKKLGVQRAAISRFERNGANLTIDTIQRAVEALGGKLIFYIHRNS